MSTSVSEFALIVLVATLLFAGLVARFPWLQGVFATVFVAQVASLAAGDTAGWVVLAVGLGVVAVRAIIKRRQSTPAA